MKFKLEANNPILIGIIAVLILGALFLVESTKNNPSATTGATVPLKEDTSGLPIAPELQGIHAYLNSDEDLSLASLKGKVVLVDFWTYSCINCIRTLPYLVDWYEKYADKGLVIIGVHAPEFAFEKELDNVKRAVEKHGILYPVVLDNDFATWRAYNNHHWPHKFLVDSEGKIRYDHIGEGSYAETEEVIVKLLKERDTQLVLDSAAGVGDVEKPDFTQIGTPELYLGYGFQRKPLGNPENLNPEQTISYTFPVDGIEPNTIYLDGNWESKEGFIRLVSDTGRVALWYQAKNVNIVAGSPNPAQINLVLDSQSLSENNAGDHAVQQDGAWIVPVQEETLYNIVSASNYDPHLLIFEVQGKGFELYTFTFG
jgi:thiol-disulfide isomerase/thioredoxin